jgi:site-specific recombinase XerD
MISTSIRTALRTALQAWLDDRPAWPGAENVSALLITRRSGARLSDRAARTIITAAGDSARITPPFGPHVLRHTFATRQLRHGVDMLGHARLDNTLIYTRPTDADRAAAIATLLTDD